MKTKSESSLLKVSLLTFILIYLPILVKVAITGYWRTGCQICSYLLINCIAGFLQDGPWWVWSFTLVFPTIYYFYWFPRQVNQVMVDQLSYRVDMLGERRDEIAMLLARFRKSFSHWVWIILSAIMPILFYPLFMIFTGDTNDFAVWRGLYRFFPFSHIFWYMVSFLFFMTIIRVMVFITWIYRHHNRLQVAGMASVYKMLVGLSTLVCLYGISTVATIWFSCYFFYGEIMLDITTIGAFLPLSLFVFVLFTFVMISVNRKVRLSRRQISVSVDDSLRLDKKTLVMILFLLCAPFIIGVAGYWMNYCTIISFCH